MPVPDPPLFDSDHDMSSLNSLENAQEFVARHIGPDAEQIRQMLESVGAASLDDLVAQTLPEGIRLNRELALPSAISEASALNELKQRAQQNRILKSLIGLGYHDCITPPVILRNVLENPGWYTAYTPYQAEIAQGRLEALLSYQQMIIDLTGMDVANASLLDEATAAAEAMAMAKRAGNHPSNRFFVADDVLPQTLDVLKTRAGYFGFELVVAPAAEISQHQVFGALFSYPGAQGELVDLKPLIEQAHAQKALVAVATDLLALTLLTPPGELGADIVLGSSQRFGVPLGFGGPHAAFFAARDSHKRSLPGRIIGVSVDAQGKPALRMALQTREQHIRREKANSNICTSQVLLANIAAFYAIYHGPEGLKRIATRISRLTQIFKRALIDAGIAVLTQASFDTLVLQADTSAVLPKAEAAGYNLRILDGHHLSLSFNETTTRTDLVRLLALIAPSAELDFERLDTDIAGRELPAALRRQSAFLTHPVFNSYHSETSMLRYLKQLENRDLALNHAMIPLGSCTMKLNAVSEMLPVTWPEFGNLHPFVPLEQAQGYLQMIAELKDWLIEVTGYDAISMQPNSGAQGEYAGLAAIARYHESRGDTQRKICLIPKSAHGTNPATAQMLGMSIQIVNCDDQGNVEVADLRQKAAQAGDQLAALMITYPSTHGVFEEAVQDICAIIHQHGGQVYLDGANLNAMVGLARPGDVGADVSHLNLHKTFCIPHGGGGPGMGPIGVKAHLIPFLPNHSVQPIPGRTPGSGAVSAAPWGSASILPISWMYIRMMGGQGLKRATQVALLNANYIAKRLAPHYPLLYTGRNQRVAHECIIDLRPLKTATGITEVDIAKRLMDYGFHAPTMSFPVPGTFMIEPTESESKFELDRFIDAMIAIRDEIEQVANGQWDPQNNPLKQAPHSVADIGADWDRPYSRQTAFYPLPYVAANKFWPFVNRIDDVYGDRNLFCACVPTSSYEQS